MATKNTLTMGYVLKKFKNARSSANNRWFAHVDRQGTLSTRGLAEHMIDHGLEIGDGFGDPNRAKRQRKTCFSLCFRDAAYFRDLSQS